MLLDHKLMYHVRLNNYYFVYRTFVVINITPRTKIFLYTQDVMSIVGREIQLTKDYTTGNATFKQGSRGTVIEAPSRKDGKLKVKLDNDNEKTFRLIKECDLQLYEGGPLSFSSESQTEETSFEY